MVNATTTLGDDRGEGIPATYKVWVFGSKLAGIIAFAIGIEMLTRANPAWAVLMLTAGATLVLWPVGPPGGWGEDLPWRRRG